PAPPCAVLPVVLAGDYNVVPTVRDIYQTRSLDDNAVIQPESRQAFAGMLTQGWTDALRRLDPDGPLWTLRSSSGTRTRPQSGLTPSAVKKLPVTSWQRTSCAPLAARTATFNFPGIRIRARFVPAFFPSFP